MNGGGLQGWRCITRDGGLQRVEVYNEGWGVTGVEVCSRDGELQRFFRCGTDRHPGHVFPEGLLGRCYAGGAAEKMVVL